MGPGSTRRDDTSPELGGSDALVALVHDRLTDLTARVDLIADRLTALEAGDAGPAPAPADDRAPAAVGWTGLPFRRLLALALALHIAAFAFIGAFFPISQDYTDVFAYQAYGQKMQAGQVPYRDFTVEYPPLATPFFWLPVYLSHDWDSYARAFTAEMLVVELAGTGVALWAVRRFAPRVPPWGVLLAQPLWLIAVGRGVVFARFDLVPAVLALLAVALFAARHERWAWGVLGLAVAAKLYPVILVPFFIIAAWRRRPPRQFLADVGAFAAAILLPALVVARGDLTALTKMFAYHLDRGLEIETVYASALMVAHFAGSPAQYVYGHGSVELAAPLAPFFTALAVPLTAIALALVYRVAWREREALGGKLGEGIAFDRLVRLSALAVLAFILAGKVLSPQYLLWLYPLAAVFTDRPAVKWWALYGAALALTHWLFPIHWDDLVALRPPTVAVLTARNGLLLLLGALLFAGLYYRPVRPPSAPAGTEVPW
ncbi:MAG TPA: glycosyltransferase family 87 protein [Thermomicrobiales bacterium]|nr:glycosyltransferase family 87 protein [Thermomicrobiales bacterium]